MNTAMKLMNILEVLISSEQNVGIRGIAELSGVPRSSVQRLLSDLQEKDWVTRDPETQSYRIGIKFLIFANTWRLRFELVRQSRAIMEELSAKTGNTVLLLVLEGTSGICLDKVEPERALKLVADVGKSFPLYAAACGKIILAYAPLPVQEKVLSTPFKSFTPSTINDPSILREEIKTIKSRGCALSCNELTAGAAEIAVPLLDWDGNFLAALSIAGPLFEMEGHFDGYEQLLRRAALEITGVPVSCREDAKS